MDKEGFYRVMRRVLENPKVTRKITTQDLERSIEYLYSVFGKDNHLEVVQTFAHNLDGLLSKAYYKGRRDENLLIAEMNSVVQ